MRSGRARCVSFLQYYCDALYSYVAVEPVYQFLEKSLRIDYDYIKYTDQIGKNCHIKTLNLPIYEHGRYLNLLGL